MSAQLRDTLSATAMTIISSGWRRCRRGAAISLLAFIVVFLTAGCSPTTDSKDLREMEPQAQIEHVLSKDQRYANQLARQLKNGISERQALATYVENIFEIDVSPLPKDFRLAFGEHRQAWREQKEALSAAPKADSSSLMNVRQALMQIGGESRVDLGAWMNLISEIGASDGNGAESKIGETWKRVQELAAQHGATVEVAPYRYPDETLVTLMEAHATLDPSIRRATAPDIRLTLSVDGAEMCSLEEQDVYDHRVGCEFLVRPSSKVRAHLVDDDLDAPDSIGTWKGSGKELLSDSARSSGQVLRLTVEKKRSDLPER